MTDVIHPNDYQRIAAAYASVINDLTARDAFLYQSIESICGIQTGDGEVKIDLLKDFVKVYSEYVKQNESSLLSAVRCLNSHVTKRSSFSSVSNYLRSNNTQVSQEWADLCAASGTVIAEDLIS